MKSSHAGHMYAVCSLSDMLTMSCMSVAMRKHATMSTTHCCRHRLGGISTGAAEVLLGTLQASSAWHPEASAQVMRLAMPLLARFVLTTSRLALGPRHAASQQTMSTSATSPPAITPAGVTEHAVAWVVGRLRGSSAPLPPGAVAPAVLFMGTGFRGVCMAAMLASCCGECAVLLQSYYRS